jgi:hypothetical protein
MTDLKQDDKSITCIINNDYKKYRYNVSKVPLVDNIYAKDIKILEKTAAALSKLTLDNIIQSCINYPTLLLYMIKTKRLLLNDVYRDIDDKYLCKYYINNEYTSIDYDIIKGILDLKMDLKDTTIIEKCAKTLPIIEYALHIGYHFNIERINFIALNIVNVYNIYNRYRNQCNNPDYLDIKKNSLLINHILNSSNDNDNNTVDNSISLDHILIDLKYMIQYGAVLDKKFVIEYNYIDIDEEFDLDTLHNENILSDEQYRQCQQWISEKGEENRRLVIPTKKAELPEKMSEIIHVTRFIGKLSTNELTIINNNPIIF